ncbi:molybdenum cofactor synthesis 2 [Crepidotus variabilis]|uniref:Molybdenum cofactor synthesis 2 n=1 Tax=Crepidotus variabilis TaxID=179855 RepID=A0A9P6EV16_9AGAR|nr:molybdenum cofactor synthesis 2 [Crepidotus variabilis]
MDSRPPASIEAYLETAQHVCALTYNHLDTQRIISSVEDHGAGAIAVFIGTTRNSFHGKRVTRLEYQAYSRIAIRTLSTIASTVVASATRSDHQPEVPLEITRANPIIRCAIHHRLGTIPVGEASIVIAVSAPHRHEAFAVCEELLEEVKKKAQIWKREFYEGEDDSAAEWKVNT